MRDWISSGETIMPNIDELKTIPILGKLHEQALVSLAAIVQERKYPAGKPIFVEGSEEKSLFIILSGNVLISKMTASGTQKPIATLTPGGFFGEMALFDDFVRSATATAIGPARLLQISKDAFLKFLLSDAAGASHLLLDIMRSLAPRIRQTNLELVALYEAGRIIGEGGEVGRILSGLLMVLNEATACQRGAAFLINPSAETLECRAAFGYEDDPSEWSEQLTGGLAEEVLQAEGAVAYENYPGDATRVSQEPVGYETPSMLAVALRVQGNPIGLVVLCDKADREGNPINFTSGDANVLSGVAAQASSAIDNARLHEEAREKEKLDRVYFRF